MYIHTCVRGGTATTTVEPQGAESPRTAQWEDKETGTSDDIFEWLAQTFQLSPEVFLGCGTVSPPYCSWELRVLFDLQLNT